MLLAPLLKDAALMVLVTCTRHPNSKGFQLNDFQIDLINENKFYHFRIYYFKFMLTA